MIQHIGIKENMKLADYGAVAYLAGAVQELRDEAATLVPALRGRTVWMINSTAKGGGVAEMLPKMVSLLEELGVPTRWLVLSPDRQSFFECTKHIHNMVHGAGQPTIHKAEADTYHEVSRDHAPELRAHLRPGDILVVHDPQPLELGALVRKEMDIHAIWRCHIGLDESNDATRAAWAFMRPFAEAYDRTIFSAPEYIPDFLAHKAKVIHPALDPLSHKNRHLTPHKLTGIFCNGGLTVAHAPVLTPPFPTLAQRLQPDGSFAKATIPDEIGLLFRSVVVQISRWDSLKGWLPLMKGFALLKKRFHEGALQAEERHLRRLELVRLVLAGPDPASVQDDPEGREVLSKLCRAYVELDAKLQDDIALITLPMDSRKNNALIVNALQRCATIVAQNSLREGFGLTATEAMWKGTPILGTQACGLRHQIRDGVDGRLVQDPENPEEIADLLNDMLRDNQARDKWGRNAQKHVHDRFLIFFQLCEWLRVMARVVKSRKAGY